MGSPGDAELRLAGRAAVVAVVGAFFATLLSDTSNQLLLSVAFLLWLMTLLAASRAVLAGSIGLWKRRHA